MFSFPLKLRTKSTSYTDVKVFLPLPDEGIFQIRAQVLNLRVPRASSQQRGRSPRPSGQVHSILPGGRSSRSWNNYSRTSPGRRNAPRAKSHSSSFQRRPWAPKRDFRSRSQSPGRSNGPTRANFGTKSRTPYNNGNRPTSM